MSTAKLDPGAAAPRAWRSGTVSVRDSLRRVFIICANDTRLLLAAAVALGVAVFIGPEFRGRIPEPAASEFTAQVAATASALDTWKATHGLPISSTEIREGTDYPFVLFGNMGFYLIAALVSGLLGAPAFIGVGLTLAIGFALGTCSIYRISRDAGLNRYLSVALGFLYATGPYLSVDLFVRNSFPEYLAWQTVPALLLVLGWAMRPGAGALAVLFGALALAAPFYLHKLISPHVVITLVVLSFNAAPWRPATIFRLGLIGVLAALFSVPGWYPAVRGMELAVVRSFGGNEPPAVFHTTLINLFWPYATNSLPNAADYQGRFALQAGFVPFVGFLVSAALLFTQPRLAWQRRIVLPFALFIVNVVLVMGWLRIWEFVPSPLRYVQFAYRLIGLIHLLGFLLLIRSLGSSWVLLHHIPPRTQRFVTIGFVILGVLNIATYWHWPRAIPRASADIQPMDLGDLDKCSFCPPTPLSGLITRAALRQDRELLVPPWPILVPTEARSPSVILAATVPTELFESNPEKIIVRIYGFSTIEPGASVVQLNGIVNSPVNSSPFGTLTARYDEARREARVQGTAAGEAIQFPGASWTIRPLAEVSVSEPGPFKLTTPMDASIDAIAIECSRGVLAAGTEVRARCMELNYLAAPNRGTEFIVPRKIPRSNVTRRALGTVIVDARKLKAGDYVLPTFDYDFVRVVDADGSSVPTYTFNRRPVIRHTGGTTSYMVTYDFGPERLALLGGVALFVVSMIVMRMWRRRGRSAVDSATVTVV